MMLSGNGTGPDYFRDLSLSAGMGNRTPSMMQNDVDNAPCGGSFYDSLSKHGDSFPMQGGPYGSFRKAFPATPANPAGGVKRFIKPADPAGPRRRGETSSPGDDAAATLQRYDSTNKLQRQYSIAGQFYRFNNANFPRGGGMPGFGGNLSRAAMCPKPQLASNLKLNAQNGSIYGMNVTSLNAQAFGQRRLGSDPKRRSFHSIGEGTSQTSPSAGSLPLERKDSQKRVGMYFKKVNHERDGMEYRKEGETTESTRNPDYKSDGSSQVCYVKPILLYEAEVSPRGGGGESSVEIDGCTVRYSKAPQEEIHKYDMSDVVCVKIASDVEVQSDSLDEIREHFLCGSNVSMIMADMDGAATNPQTWFSWLALKYVVKETFARLDSHSEFTMSACLLQDDQVMDLFGDGNLQFEPLKVAESPYFGNVAHGLTYIAIDSAKSFNQSLSRCLAAAGKQMERNKDEEQGIILITSLLKQIRTSKSGNKDVWISSIFSTGVGDGIIHYNRILDKNPAEPRAVFYAALHRSVYSTAIFSLRERSQGLYQCLSTLQRFSKVETRKPKVNSVSMFIHFAEMTIAKMKEDMQAAQNTPRYPMIVKFLEKMEIMLADSREMLESPESCIPKTYM
ncbi:unnamed protein product [Phytomonas sp. EM1]|nr:unnamed protein product [Phytomonas sp. EM1]|eukprot:CCW65686.1 unnamed protein product [Phytomonas sp. isolate EM1]